MSMKNQKGVVKYQERDDIVCSYGIRDDNKQFYYLDVNNGNPFKNGNRVATTALVEAVDPMVKASNIGLIDAEGKEIIPFNNRSIRPVNDDIIIVEPAVPVTQSVIDAIQLKSDPLSATKLVSTPALIKEKLNAKVGAEGRYLFNDQFSEATVCDINGNNLVNDERYSFIVSNGKELFFSKNTVDSDITSYSILPPEVQSDVTPATDTQAIDVSNVEVAKDVVENALNAATPSEKEVEKSAPVENAEIEPPTEEVVQEVPVSNESEPEKVEVAENTSIEPVQNTSMENGFEIPKVSVDIPTIPEGAFAAAGAPDHTEAAETVVPNAERTAEEPISVTEEVKEKVSEEQTPVEDEVKEETTLDTTSVDSNLSKEKVLQDDEMVDAPIEDIFSDSVIPDKIEDTDEEDTLDTDSVDDMKEENPLDLVSPEAAEDDEMESVDIDDKVDQLVFDDELEDVSVDDVDDIEEDNTPVSDTDFTYSYDDTEFKESKYNNDDNIMADVAKSMTAMMNRIRVLEAELSEEQVKSGKLTASRRTLVEKNKMLGKKVEILTNKNTSLEATISKANSTNSILENRVHEQKRIIDAQSQELHMLRPLLHDKEKVVGILADAQALLDDGATHKIR